MLGWIPIFRSWHFPQIFQWLFSMTFWGFSDHLKNAANIFWNKKKHFIWISNCGLRGERELGREMPCSIFFQEKNCIFFKIGPLSASFGFIYLFMTRWQFDNYTFTRSETGKKEEEFLIVPSHHKQKKAKDLAGIEPTTSRWWGVYSTAVPSATKNGYFDDLSVSSFERKHLNDRFKSWRQT